MAKTGRKRKPGVERYATGRIVRAQDRETTAQIVATVAAQPHRLGNTTATMGYAHGRLYGQKIISRRQHEAAEVFMSRAIAYMASISNSLPKFPSIAADMVARGLSCRSELTPEQIGAIRSNYGELQDAFMDAGRHHEWNGLLTRLCIMDRDPTRDEIGEIRLALNAIANRLRFPKDDD